MSQPKTPNQAANESCDTEDLLSAPPLDVLANQTRNEPASEMIKRLVEENNRLQKELRAAKAEILDKDAKIVDIELDNNEWEEKAVAMESQKDKAEDELASIAALQQDWNEKYLKMTLLYRAEQKEKERLKDKLVVLQKRADGNHRLSREMLDVRTSLMESLKTSLLETPEENLDKAIIKHGRKAAQYGNILADMAVFKCKLRHDDEKQQIFLKMHDGWAIDLDEADEYNYPLIIRWRNLVSTIIIYKNATPQTWAKFVPFFREINPLLKKLDEFWKPAKEMLAADRDGGFRLFLGTPHVVQQIFKLERLVEGLLAL
jgi:hypothetical protein